jgi:hypothetical protein
MIYENQKKGFIDFVLELITDSIPTIKSFPLSYRSYFFIWEYEDSFGMDREGKYEQRRGR